MSSRKRKIVLHACCAPDAAVAIERLKGEYRVAVCFYNPNIHPREEYVLRREEMMRVAEIMHVDMIDCEYDDCGWFAAVQGYEGEPERGRRCQICFEMRLQRTAEIARQHGADLFGTVLTVSPHKDARLINQIGTALSQRCNVEFLITDFKKMDGFKRSVELSRTFNLYRQKYCGCSFSKNSAERSRRAK